MVEELRSQGIKDERVLFAINKIPRHLFVEEAMQGIAYQLAALPLADGQSISHPLTVARMTELLELKRTERVLEIGTGSGYQTAVLAELCEKVFSVECIRSLLVQARRCLESLDYYNVLIKFGDGNEGWAEMGPYDAIIVTAGAKEYPKLLGNQLKEGGKLIIPVGDQEQEIFVQRKIGGSMQTIQRFPCKFVELVAGQKALVY
ncbi:MAG: protein-L-isoaspartate(D-aspartate) O-methyltransferase [Candidatus Schekmanbacteria bacterium]|nr:protein-L-isoaspartate(D-aspartate) O-methyltransferase [Candidatus Schekmanbacteria bacterium]